MAEFSAEKIKHLEMLQKVIERMAGESGRIKQVALAAVAAIVSVSASTQIWWLPFAGVVLILAFWYLDAGYLAQERWFRDLFEKERKQGGEGTFVMTPPSDIRGKHKTGRTMLGWSTFFLYGVLILINLITSAALYIAKTHTPPAAQAIINNSSTQPRQ